MRSRRRSRRFHGSKHFLPVSRNCDTTRTYNSGSDQTKNPGAKKRQNHDVLSAYRGRASGLSVRWRDHDAVLLAGVSRGGGGGGGGDFISMLNIRMSRTPIEGSPVPGCLTPRLCSACPSAAFPHIFSKLITTIVPNPAKKKRSLGVLCLKTLACGPNLATHTCRAAVASAVRETSVCVQEVRADEPGAQGRDGQHKRRCSPAWQQKTFGCDALNVET